MDVEKYNSLFSKKEIKEVAEPLQRKSNLKDNLLNAPKSEVAINAMETFHPIKNILESLSFKPELYELEPSALLDFERFSSSTHCTDLGDEGTTKFKSITKLQKQQTAILKAIETKQFQPMEIPDNEKKTIKSLCELDYPALFKAETAFDRAWKNGIGKLWKMENHESYSKRGNN